MRYRWRNRLLALRPLFWPWGEIAALRIELVENAEELARRDERETELKGAFCRQASKRVAVHLKLEQSRERVAELEQQLSAVVAWGENEVVGVDWRWGACRSLEQLYETGMIDQVLLAARKSLGCEHQTAPGPCSVCGDN